MFFFDLRMDRDKVGLLHDLKKNRIRVAAGIVDMEGWVYNQGNAQFFGSFPGVVDVKSGKWGGKDKVRSEFNDFLQVKRISRTVRIGTYPFVEWIFKTAGQGSK